jgi:hypothetical protein
MPLPLSFGVEFEFAFVVNRKLVKDTTHWLHVAKDDKPRPGDATDHNVTKYPGHEQLARILVRDRLSNQVLPDPKTADQDYYKWGVTSDCSVVPTDAILLKAAVEDPDYFAGRVTEANVQDFDLYGMEVVSRILEWEPLPNGTTVDVQNGPYHEIQQYLNAIRGRANDPFMSFVGFEPTGLHVHIGLPPTTSARNGPCKRQKDQDQIAAGPPRKRVKLSGESDSGDATLTETLPLLSTDSASAGAPNDDGFVSVDAVSGLARFSLPLLQQLACLLLEFEGVINLLHPESRRGLIGSSKWARSNRIGVQGNLHVCDRLPTRLSRELAHRIFSPDMTVGLLVNLMSDGGNNRNERNKFVNWTNLIQHRRRHSDDEHPKTTLEFRQHAGSLSVEDTCQWVHLVGSLVRTAERRALANWGPQNIETNEDVERAFIISKTGPRKYSELQWRYWEHEREFDRFCTALSLPQASQQYWQARYQRLNPRDFGSSMSLTKTPYWQALVERIETGNFKDRRPNWQALSIYISSNAVGFAGKNQRLGCAWRAPTSIYFADYHPNA